VEVDRRAIPDHLFSTPAKTAEAKEWARKCDTEVKRGVWLVDLAYDVLYAANLEGNRLNSTVLSDKKNASLLAEHRCVSRPWSGCRSSLMVIARSHGHCRNEHTRRCEVAHNAQ